MTAQQRQLWNRFIALNPTPQNARDVFNSLHSGYDFCEFTVMVQRDIKAYRSAALDEIHTGKASFDRPDSLFMPGLSKIDGIAGVKTLHWKFPEEQYLNVNKQNDVYQLAVKVTR